MLQYSNKNHSIALVASMAVAIALAIGMLPLVLQFSFSYGHESAIALNEAKANTELIERFIRSNSGLSTAGGLHLEKMLTVRENIDQREQLISVYNLNDELVATTGNVPPFLSLSRRATLYDSGNPVGYIQVTRDLKPEISEALWLAVASILLSFAVFHLIRRVVLKPLDQAINRICKQKDTAVATLHSIGDAVIVTDGKLKVEYLNPVAEKLTGITMVEACGRHVDDVFKLYDDALQPQLGNQITQCLITEALVLQENYSVLVRQADDEELHIEHTAAPIKFGNGIVSGAVVTFSDVTDRKNAQNRLQHIAFHDTLTGLPNRILFRKRLVKALTDARFLGKQVAVMFLDLDKFKPINDTLGHAIGDELLVLVAKRLEKCVRESDLVCRIGGDEFTAVLSNINSPDNARGVAEKIIDSICKTFNVKGNEISISTSIGIAIYPKDGEELEALIKNADTAMYYAKAQGRSNFQYFDPAMSVKAERDVQIDTALKTALEKQQFFLEYQPKLDLKLNQVVGCEALLRWESPEFGQIQARDLIPRLEEGGLLVKVGLWILETAVQQAKCWMDQGYSVKVSVNLSKRQFRHPKLVDQITATLKSSGLPASFLQIEITENLLMEGGDIEEVMNRLINIGVSISLDDFGTGYSSLNYLRRFPISELKIDQTVVKDMSLSETAAGVAKTLIDIGQTLGMRVTAEGVETHTQRAKLQNFGCNDIQGYLISPPVPGHAILSLLGELQRLPAGDEKSVDSTVKNAMGLPHIDFPPIEFPKENTHKELHAHRSNY